MTFDMLFIYICAVNRNTYLNFTVMFYYFHYISAFGETREVSRLEALQAIRNKKIAKGEIQPNKEKNIHLWLCGNDKITVIHCNGRRFNAWSNMDIVKNA